MISKFVGIANPTFVDNNELTDLQKKAKRHSIADPAVIKALPAKEVKELAKSGSATKQIVLFMIGVSALRPRDGGLLADVHAPFLLSLRY